MIAESVLDTNILVYAATGRGEDSWKRHVALNLMQDQDFATSGQILQEFFVTTTKKAKNRFSVDDALFWIERLAEKTVIPVDFQLVSRAITISKKYMVSYWDGAIIAAAEKVEAKILYTEDLNHGQFYGSVQAINPFLSKPTGMQEQ